MADKVATFVKDVDGFSSKARLYAVEPPVAYSEWDDGEELQREAGHVIVSATIAPFTGAETYIFPATPGGNVLNWGELDGSFRGALDHERALREAGYAIDKEG